MTIPRPPRWLLIGLMVACFIALLRDMARGENCLTNTNTGTMNTVGGATAGFFQLGTSDVVRFPNPPGITNSTGVTTTGSTTTPGNALTGLSCGNGAQASGANGLALGRNAKASGTNSVALGANSTASGANSMALGANSTATRDNTVSVGTPSDPRTISNVAAGTAPGDAVNNQQLSMVSTAQNIQNIALQSQINNVQQQVTTLKRQTFAGVSMAMAAAALQTGAGSAGAGKVAIGMGGGEFGGTASLSAGIAYSPTKRLNFNAGVSWAPVVNMFGVFGGSTLTLN